MIIQYISDIHLEFYTEYHPDILEKYIKKKGDILLLAGDIDTWTIGWEFSPIWDWFSENFKHTIYVPGNHEYYNSTIKLSLKPIHQQIKDNVTILNNSFVDIDNIRIIGSTLWTNIDPLHQFQIQRGMNDFYKIKTTEGNLNPNFINDLNQLSTEFIFNNITDNSVVITHHLPSFACIHPKFQGNILNSAFANKDLDNKIYKEGPKYWIYGHSHGQIDDIQFNKTILTCNQLGYPNELKPNTKTFTLK